MRTSHRERHGTRRRPVFERLEARIVLDSTIGTWVDPWESEAGLASFSSSEELEQFLVRDALARYGDLFGQPAWHFGWYRDVWTAHVAVPRTSSQPAADHSTTNVQVEGVDEGDLIKTDGHYVYVARRDDFSIIDARSVESPQVIARQQVDGQIRAIYLADDRLTVISQAELFRPMPRILPRVRVDGWEEAWEIEPHFQVTVFDVRAPESPSLISRFELDGQFSDSRLLGETIYLVSQSDFYLPTPRSICVAADPVVGARAWADSPGSPIDDLAGSRWMPPFWGEDPRCFYETESDYLARYEGRVLEAVLPGYTRYDSDGRIDASGLLVSAESVFWPLGRDRDRLLSITAIALSSSPTIADSTAVPTGWTDRIYMSHENLVVAAPTVLMEGNSRSGTGLLQFALQGTGGGLELTAHGAVSGWMPNVFAMDEHDGFFRIVTQEGWGAEASTRLHVLQAIDGRLVTIGDLQGLAPGENLYSVRFLGDQAFVVTFGPIDGNWIDPLWTIDLSEPTEPRVVGQLEIPGFSDYLHWAGANHLLGLGRDADVETGQWLAPQVSLFDVTDFAAPQLSGRVTFDEAGWSWSEAFGDHHAVSYFPESGVLAIPMTTFGLRAADRDDQRVELPDERHDLWVFRIDANSDADQPVRVLGQIEHETPVRRSLRIGSALLSVSQDELQVHPLLDPTRCLARLPLGPLVSPDFFDLESDRGAQRLDVLANDFLNRDGSGRISEVTEAEQGGLVEIAADGRSLIYTPAEGFEGLDRFVYEAMGNAGQESATVEVLVTASIGTDPADRARDRLVRLAIDDLAGRLQVLPGAIELESVDNVDWPDSCLGLPTDAACLMVIVPGYRIRLSYEGQVHVYHSDRDSRLEYAGQEGSTEAAPLVRIRLEATDAQGHPLARVATGEPFVLSLYAEDLREEALGVFGAYLDVLYHERLLRLDGEIEFGGEFANGRIARIDHPGVIGELGAVAGLSPLGEGQRLIASIPVVAERAGRTQVSVIISDQAGSEVLLYGASQAVPERQVVLEGTELVVRHGWHNFDEPTDVNLDEVTTPLDALLIVNRLNREGIGPLGPVPEDDGQTSAISHHLLDVNRDGNSTPLDVLLTVNILNDRDNFTAVFADEDRAGGTAAGLAAVAEYPLVSWVSWPVLLDELSTPRWQPVLDTLQMSAADASRLTHRLLVAADVRLDDLSRNEPWWTQHTSEAIQRVWHDYRSIDGGTMTIDQANAALGMLEPRLEQLDFEQLLPGLTRTMGLDSTDTTIRDAVLAQFGDSATWLTLLGM